MTSNNSPGCPKGEGECPIYDEVEALKQQVAELAEQVRTDSLTGLFNKRHLLTSLDMELERSCRSEQPTSLIMLDVDHFKSFNDNYGHIAGDKVLQIIAKTIKNTIRKIDVACRYGGEEFSIVLPSTPLLVADHVAERIRDQISTCSIDINGKKLHVTASLGVASFTHNQTSNSETLIERADQQLYRAKHSGRNQVCIEPQMDDTKSSVSEAEREALFSNPIAPPTNEKNETH